MSYYQEELKWSVLEEGNSVYEADITHGISCKCCTRIIDSYRNSIANTNTKRTKKKNKDKERGGNRPTVVQKDRSWLLRVLG